MNYERKISIPSATVGCINGAEIGLNSVVLCFEHPCFGAKFLLVCPNVKTMPRKKLLRQLAKVQRSNDELAPPPSQRFFFSKKLYMFVGATNTLAMGIHFHASLPSSIPVYKKVDNVSVFRCLFRGFKRSSKYRCLVNTHVLHGCPLLCCLY